MVVKVIKASDLGNCWLPNRFMGGECPRLKKCKYPEKKTCLAWKDQRVYSTQRTYAKEA